MEKSYIILHHSGISRKVQPFQFDAINNYHKKAWGYISKLGFYGGYHYLIESDGSVKQYRLDEETGAHCRGKNEISIGIGLTGNFSKEGEYPTPEQKNALQGLLRSLMTIYKITPDKIVPHRKFCKTECYGKNLSDDWAQKLVEIESEEKKEELKKKIGIIKRIIEIYLKLIDLIKKGRN